MEHAIGTKITLEVVENTGAFCDGCFFNINNACDDEIKCQWYDRPDEKNIIYKVVKEEK